MPRRGLIFLVCLLVLSFGSVLPAMAQTNLLTDPGMEGAYSGRDGRGDFNIPAAWSAWYTNSPSTEAWMNVDPIAFPHTAGFKHEGAQSLHINRGGGTFTAAVYQVVPNIAAGTALRATAWAYIENAGGSGAQVRIGIGSGVGGNPLAGGITWSAWGSAVNGWNQLSVDAVAAGGDVTLFLYATQTWPNDPNGVYWDETSLVATGTGEVPPSNTGGDTGGDTGGTTGSTTGGPTGPTVGFVQPQGTRDDGSVVHRVQPGDTINSIAVAYGVPASEILRLNNISNARLISVGQELIIRPPNSEAEATAEPGNEGTADESSLPDDTGGQPIGPAITAEVEPTVETTPLPTDTPTPTEIPPTPTEAPPAPVAVGQPPSNPADLAATVCVLMFEDINHNRIREENEALLGSGSIALTQNGSPLGTLEIDAVSQPACFDNVGAGEYQLVATAPTNYTLTSPALYHVQVHPGERVGVVAFGVATDAAAFNAPQPDSPVETSPDTETPPQRSALEQLFDISGLLLVGLAGIVLVGGIGITMVLRRR